MQQFKIPHLVSVTLQRVLHPSQEKLTGVCSKDWCLFERMVTTPQPSSPKRVDAGEKRGKTPKHVIPCILQMCVGSQEPARMRTARVNQSSNL